MKLEIVLKMLYVFKIAVTLNCDKICNKTTLNLSNKYLEYEVKIQ